MLPVQMLFNVMQWLRSDTRGVWLPLGALLLALTSFILNQEFITSRPPRMNLVAFSPPNGTYSCFSLGTHGGRGANEGIDIIYKVQKKAFFPSFSGQWRWWSSCGLALQPEGLGWDPGFASMACKAQTPDSVSPMRISALFPHTSGLGVCLKQGAVRNLSRWCGELSRPSLVGTEWYKGSLKTPSLPCVCSNPDGWQRSS